MAVAIVLTLSCGGAVAETPTRKDAGADASTLDAGSGDGDASDGSVDADARPTKPYTPWAQAYGGNVYPAFRALATGPGGVISIVGNDPQGISFGGPVITGTYVAGLDRKGEPTFTVVAGTSSSSYVADEVLAIDGSGTTHLMGRLGGALDFGGGPESSADFFDVIYAAISSSGNELAHRLVRHVSLEGMTATTQGDVYALMVTRQGTVDFGGGLQTFAATDIVLVKYGAGAAWKWQRVIGHLGTYNYGGLFKLRSSASGDVLVQGGFGNDAVINVDSAPYVASPSAAESFFAVIDGGGATKVARRFAGATLSDVDFDDQGNVYAVFSSFSTFDLGGGPVSGIVVGKWTPLGAFTWAKNVAAGGYFSTLFARGQPEVDVLVTYPFLVGDSGLTATVSRRRLDANGNDKGTVGLMGKWATPVSSSRDEYGSLVILGNLSAPGDFGFGPIAPLYPNAPSLFVASLHP